jgi:hypothetical protein
LEKFEVLLTTDPILIFMDNFASIKEVDKNTQAIKIVSLFIKAIPEGALKI